LLIPPPSQITFYPKQKLDKVHIRCFEILGTTQIMYVDHIYMYQEPLSCLNFLITSQYSSSQAITYNHHHDVHHQTHHPPRPRLLRPTLNLQHLHLAPPRRRLPRRSPPTPFRPKTHAPPARNHARRCRRNPARGRNRHRAGQRSSRT
jgi:hypothetical protein